MTLPLLDVNVLIALADPDHVHHERAHAWASHGLANGWASCAITENGFVRILSQPAYPGAFTVAAAVGLLRSARAVSGHQFWPSNVSLADPEILDATSLLGHRLITDASRSRYGTIARSSPSTRRSRSPLSLGRRAGT